MKKKNKFEELKGIEVTLLKNWGKKLKDEKLKLKDPSVLLKGVKKGLFKVDEKTLTKFKENFLKLAPGKVTDVTGKEAEVKVSELAE